jgi:hypothetical protein
MNSVNKIPLLSFCMHKTNRITYLTAGRSGDDSVHVSSVITATLRSENVWGWAFSDKKKTLLVTTELALWRYDKAFLFYQPVGGWYWNCPRKSILHGDLNSQKAGIFVFPFFMPYITCVGLMMIQKAEICRLIKLSCVGCSLHNHYMDGSNFLMLETYSSSYCADRRGFPGGFCLTTFVEISKSTKYLDFL